MRAYVFFPQDVHKHISLLHLLFNDDFNNPTHGQTALSSAELSFVFPVRWGMGRGKNKARGSWGEDKLPIVPHAPPISLLSPFSLSFPRFLAVSPLKEPLRRREARAHQQTTRNENTTAGRLIGSITSRCFFLFFNFLFISSTWPLFHF